MRYASTRCLATVRNFCEEDIANGFEEEEDADMHEKKTKKGWMFSKTKRKMELNYSCIRMGEERVGQGWMDAAPLGDSEKFGKKER